MDGQKESSLRGLLNANKMEPFIRHIRFPFYKNLAEGARIDFSFPVTVLVGQNGTNKSSVLKALYGTPNGYSLGNLWFSTSVDPIEDGGRSRIIYGYYDKDTKKIVEVIKSRIKKDRDPDYWEPSRPLTADGMNPPQKGEESSNRSKTRWKAIDKKVVYIDFRSQLSAFDKFFYHGNKVGSLSKKDFIRRESFHLRKVIDGQKSSYDRYGKNKIFSNKLFDKERIEHVSKILGREYSSVRLVTHSFFNVKSNTAILKTSHLDYSEAFAGSGEFAVIMLVDQVISSESNSLILLDEPEVSLHPGAQERLVNFLIDECIKKKHQIVVSTHSSNIINSLPKDAIKLFHVSDMSNKIDIMSNVSPEEAFFHLGGKLNKKTIFVEDCLAVEIVKKAIKEKGKAFSSQFDVKFIPGGADAIIKGYMAPFSMAKNKDVIFLLDGDKNKNVDFVISSSISQMENNTLGDKIKSMMGCDVKFIVDGNNGKANKDALYEAQRNFIDYIYHYVSYLPMSTPEKFILDNIPSDYRAMLDSIEGELPEKEIFKELCKLDLDNDECTSNDIFNTQRRIIGRIKSSSDDLVNIKNLITSFGDCGSIRKDNDHGEKK
ncbi:ATP-dependent nuclease [Erwinia oleae]|uniref:ATP-dependent nuclease n=1 Tax=Erwinia oleae TaxID=796334 RepID=UPI000552120D|nr:ATP-binding protein [Erwinia oleae]